MMNAASQSRIAPAADLPPVTAGFEPVEQNIGIWRRPERQALRPLLRSYERREASGEVSDVLISSVVTADRRNFIDLLPAVPRRLQLQRHALAEDLGRLVRGFAALVGTPSLRVKLEIERQDRCRYFHSDRIDLRLLCTYLGPGTEWVPDAFVDRSARGSGDNTAIVPEPRRVQRLAPFWVGLLKGDLHPDCPGRGCIHRSPPIAHRLNAARILLTIDAVRED